MSYTEPYNGDYDHQDLFGVGEKLWWATWETTDGREGYSAVHVRVLEIIISEQDVKYKVCSAADDTIKEAIAYDDQLYSDKKEAELFAITRLIYALDERMSDIQHSVEYHTKELNKACAERDSLAIRTRLFYERQKELDAVREGGRS